MQKREGIYIILYIILYIIFSSIAKNAQKSRKRLMFMMQRSKSRKRNSIFQNKRNQRMVILVVCFALYIILYYIYIYTHYVETSTHGSAQS